MLALALALIVTIELARTLPLLHSFAALAGAARRATRLLRRNCSEHWRERVMRLLSLHLLGRSLRAGLLLAAALVPLAVTIVSDRWWQLGVTAALGDGRSRLLVAACTIGYALIRHAARRRLFQG
ncbi:MAG TPA: hypothetical protein VF637_00595 [Sphingomicrobium sp.]